MKKIATLALALALAAVLAAVLGVVVTRRNRRQEPYKYGGNPPPGWGSKTKVYNVGIYFQWGGGSSYRPQWVSPPRKYSIKDTEATRWLSGFAAQLQKSVNTHGATAVAQRIVDGWGYELSLFAQLNALAKHLNRHTNMPQAYFDVHNAMRVRGYSVAIS